MALTNPDKQDIRVIIREETADIRQGICGLEQKTNRHEQRFDSLEQRVGGLEFQFEQFAHDIRNSYAEIKSMLENALGLA